MNRILLVMRRGLLPLLLALPVAAAADAPRLPDVAIAGSYGIAIGLGPGASTLDGGRSLELDMLGPRVGGMGWVLRGSFVRFDQGPWGSSDPTLAASSGGGRLYLPASNPWQGGQFDMAAIEIGLQRGFGSGRFRSHLEGLVGVAGVEYEGLTGAGFRNDRRADPSLQSPSGTTRDRAPTFSLGTGIELLGPLRTALSATVDAQWAPLRGLAGPIVPVRFGARWPVEPAPSADGSSPSNKLRLRLAGGMNALETPARLSGTTDAGISMSAAVEYPVRSWLALSLQGEHAVQDAEIALAREEMDPYGNLVSVLTGATAPLSLTATAVTAGVRFSLPRAAVVPFARAGVGWGRTGGFGYAVVEDHGAFLDDGTWVPATTSSPVAGGAPADGFAGSASLGLEARIAGPVRALVEGGALAIQLHSENVLVLPFRVGIELR